MAARRRISMAELPAALAADRDAAFPHLVRALIDGIYSGALRLTGSRADAEDVAQDAFLRAYRALGTYSPERIRELRLREWVWAIAANLCRNRARSAPAASGGGARPGGDPGPRPEPRAGSARRGLGRGRASGAPSGPASLGAAFRRGAAPCDRPLLRRSRRRPGPARRHREGRRAPRPAAVAHPPGGSTMSDIPARLAALREAAPAHLMPERCWLGPAWPTATPSFPVPWARSSWPSPVAGSLWWTWPATRRVSRLPTGRGSGER